MADILVFFVAVVSFSIYGLVQFIAHRVRDIRLFVRENVDVYTSRRFSFIAVWYRGIKLVDLALYRGRDPFLSVDLFDRNVLFVGKRFSQNV